MWAAAPDTLWETGSECTAPVSAGRDTPELVIEARWLLNAEWDAAVAFAIGVATRVELLAPSACAVEGRANAWA